VKIRPRGLAVAIAVLAFAVAGCGGSGSATSTTGPTADVNAACQQAISRRASIEPRVPFWREFQSDLVQYRKIAAAAKAAGVDPELMQAINALDQDLGRLIPVTRSTERSGLRPQKVRKAIGSAADRAAREADQVEKLLGDAGFKACAGLLPL